LSFVKLFIPLRFLIWGATLRYAEIIPIGPVRIMPERKMSIVRGAC